MDKRTKVKFLLTRDKKIQEGIVCEYLLKLARKVASHAGFVFYSGSSSKGSCFSFGLNKKFTYHRSLL